MRTFNILNMLGQGILYGAGATAATAGVIVSYQNGKNYQPNRIMPDNSTLETCLARWGDQNYQKAFYLLCCLLVFAPASIITFLFTCCRENRSDEEQSLLIRSQTPEEVSKKTNCSKTTLGLMQGFLGTLIIIGILGSAWTYKEADIASIFEKKHTNATTIECFGEWTHSDNLNFALNVIAFLWTLCVLAPIATLRQHWEQEPEVSVLPLQ